MHPDGYLGGSSIETVGHAALGIDSHMPHYPDVPDGAPPRGQRLGDNVSGSWAPAVFLLEHDTSTRVAAGDTAYRGHGRQSRAAGLTARVSPPGPRGDLVADVCGRLCQPVLLGQPRQPWRPNPSFTKVEMGSPDRGSPNPGQRVGLAGAKGLAQIQAAGVREGGTLPFGTRQRRPSETCFGG